MSNQEHERYLEQLEECKQEQAYIEADEAAEEEAYQIERVAELEPVDLLAVAKQTLGIK